MGWWYEVSGVTRTVWISMTAIFAVGILVPAFLAKVKREYRAVMASMAIRNTVIYLSWLAAQIVIYVCCYGH